MFKTMVSKTRAYFKPGKDAVKLTKSDRWIGRICILFMFIGLLLMIPFSSWVNEGNLTSKEYANVGTLFMIYFGLWMALLVSIIPIRRYEILKNDVKELKAKLK